jgi:hypothetical protein
LSDEGQGVFDPVVVVGFDVSGDSVGSGFLEVFHKILRATLGTIEGDDYFQ